MKRIILLCLGIWVFGYLGICILAQPAYVREQMRPKPNPPAGGGAYTPFTAGFDGSNDSMAMNGEPTGIADAKTFTFSVWLDYTGGDGALQELWWVAGSKLLVQKTTGNAVRVFATTQGGTTVWDVTSSVTKSASDGWFHLLIAADSAGAGTFKIYFDGVEDTSKTITTHSDNPIDLHTSGTPARRIGAGGSALNKTAASVCELYLSDRFLDDPTKFASGGVPISLGADGSTPDGTRPGYYFSRSGSGDLWITDSANGNNYTLTGALGSPSPP